MGRKAEPGFDLPPILPEGHAMRGQGLHVPAAPATQRAKVTDGVGCLPGEPEADGENTAADTSRVALETELLRDREILGEARVQPHGRGEASRLDQGMNGAASGDADGRQTARRTAGGAGHVKEADGQSQDTDHRGPEPMPVLAG